MTKTDLPYDTAGEILRSEIPPPDQGVHTGPKNGPDGRPHRFSTI